MPTLQDVAKRAGVSIATVSKVLSNTPYFTDATRDKVMLAVKEIGYRPNLAARALSSGKTHIIAVVFPHVYDTIFKDPLVMQILEGIEMIATPQHYNILLSTPRLETDSLEEHYHQLIQSGYVEGVIAIDNVRTASAAQVAVSYDIPTVVIGYHESQSDYSVRNDDYQGGVLQMAHLLKLGHKQIGIITIAPDTNLAVIERLRGQRDVATENGIDFDSLPTACGDFSVNSGAVAAQELLDSHPDLTALICLNDRMAMGAIQTAVARGLRVPADLTVIGYDDIPVSAVYSPPLTTINQHAVLLGEESARMLIAILNDKQPIPVVHQPTLINRGTSAEPRLNVKAIE